jgi:hypothetical protein
MPIEALDLVRADLETIENRRQQMRDAMPGTAALVDELRAVFGDVKVRHAKEGNKEVGKPQPFDGIDVNQLIRYYERRVNVIREKRR